jgi:enoyl-CoA hydratase/carnithine racemase
MSNSLAVELLERAAVVRFIRPEIRNPLSVEVLECLHGIVDSADKDRLLVFTGTEDVFASGADLREISALSAGSAREFSRRGQALMTKISERLAVAAINGYCFGGALDLALACKKRISTPNAMFSHPGANLGIITGWGGTQRLPRLIGQANALEMFFMAKRVGAAEALRIGLVDAIAEDAVDAALRGF